MTEKASAISLISYPQLNMDGGVDIMDDHLDGGVMWTLPQFTAIAQCEDGGVDAFLPDGTEQHFNNAGGKREERCERSLDIPRLLDSTWGHEELEGFYQL